MPPDPKVLLDNIIEASENIQRVTLSMDLGTFSEDFDTRAAVERWFITIGEALRRLRDHHSDLAIKIPDITNIIDFRNFLIHNYDDLEVTIIWSSITDDLPELYQTVCDLQAKLDHSQGPREVPPPPAGPRM